MLASGRCTSLQPLRLAVNRGIFACQVFSTQSVAENGQVNSRGTAHVAVGCLNNLLGLIFKKNEYFYPLSLLKSILYFKNKVPVNVYNTFDRIKKVEKSSKFPKSSRKWNNCSFQKLNFDQGLISQYNN